MFECLHVFLEYITDRLQFHGTEAERRSALLERVREASDAGVDYIQLREKDLSARDLYELALSVRQAVPRSGASKLLINSRVDIAIAAGGADGVHLRSADIAASDARVIFHRAGITAPVIAVSCHSLREVQLAESHGADFAVFGPVLSKGTDAGVGVAALAEICANVKIPVLALGGVTAENIAECMRAGAAGIAGIRLFQEPSSMADLVAKLRVSASHL